MTNHCDAGHGNTADSLAYYRDHRHQFGTILTAEIAFPGLSDHYPYCFELHDDRGNRMLLSGLTAGYAGEGPRAAMEVLIDVGFPAVKAQRVFCDRVVTLRRALWRPNTTPPLPDLSLGPRNIAVWTR